MDTPRSVHGMDNFGTPAATSTAPPLATTTSIVVSPGPAGHAPNGSRREVHLAWALNQLTLPSGYAATRGCVGFGCVEAGAARRPP